MDRDPRRAGALLIAALTPVLAACSAGRLSAAPAPAPSTADGPVVAAFRSIGWTWGGGWSSPTDLMHFSSTGH